MSQIRTIEMTKDPYNISRFKKTGNLILKVI